MSLNGTITLLICSNSENTKDFIRYLEKDGIESKLFPNLDKALMKFEDGRFGTLLLVLRGDESDTAQLEKLSVIRKLDPDLPVVVVCKNDSIEIERKARLEGVFYYFVEPVDKSELLQVLKESARFRLKKVKRRTK